MDPKSKKKTKNYEDKKSYTVGCYRWKTGFLHVKKGGGLYKMTFVFICFKKQLWNSLFSHMSLHPLCVSLGVVGGWRGVWKASGASILSQPRFRTLLSSSWAWARPLSCCIHLIGWRFLYGRSEAHAVGGVLGGVSIVVIRKLGCAVKQTTVSPRVISRWLERCVGRRLLTLRSSGKGVELSIGGVGHPGRWAGIIAACPRSWHRAGGNCTAGGRRISTGSGAREHAAWVLWAEVALVVDDTSLGTGLVMRGGSDIVVAVGRILFFRKGNLNWGSNRK